MDLKKKAKCLYWGITVLFFIPAIVFAFLALICYHIPPKRIFRDDLGEWIVGLVAKMVIWRRNYVEDWYTFRRDGYRFIIED